MKGKINKKAILIVANVLTIIISIIVLLVAIMAITNAKNGYNNLFGTTVIAVKTDSMNGNQKDSFAKNDLIVGKILNDKSKDKLQKGDIITFWMLDLVEGKKALNTHRIIEIETDANGNVVGYITKGDANTAQDGPGVVKGEIVAKYQYKLKGMGKALLFMQGRTGFLVFIVIPSILAVAYCVFLFVVNLKGYNKEKRKEDSEKLEEQLKEKLRQELLKEQGKAQQDKDSQE